MSRDEPLRTERVTVRLTPEERCRLEELARRTGRSLGQVVRLLLEQAEAGHLCDIRLARPQE